MLQRPLCVVSAIQAKTVDKSEKRNISMTNGPMRLIFYSLIVHMSTSKPWNISSIVVLVYEIRGDASRFFSWPHLLWISMENRIFEIPAESPTSSELISASGGYIDFGPSLRPSPMSILVGKNY